MTFTAAERAALLEAIDRNTKPSDPAALQAAKEKVCDVQPGKALCPICDAPFQNIPALGIHHICVRVPMKLNSTV